MEDVMDAPWSTHERDEKCIHIFVLAENLKERDHSGDSGIDGKTILG